MPEEVVDTLVAEAPAIEPDFAAYESRRLNEMSGAEVDPPEPPADLEAEASQDPEQAASETAVDGEPSQPSAAEKPEHAAASETVGETQEEKQKTGVPQSRFDEVYGQRKEAERQRDAEKARADQLAAELVEAKAKLAPVKPEPDAVAKPAEVAKPEEPQLPEKPRAPRLEDEGIEGDYERYEAARDEHQEKLTDWKLEVRAVEQQKRDAAAKVENDRQAAARVEVDARQEHINGQIAEGRKNYTDFDDTVKTLPMVPALIEALHQAPENGPDLAYYLGKNPEEFQRIAELVKLPENFTAAQGGAAMHRAIFELAKLTPKLPARGATPKPVAVLPANHKPSISRAPKPATVVTPQSAPQNNAKDIASQATHQSAETDFVKYERQRLPSLHRR